MHWLNENLCMASLHIAGVFSYLFVFGGFFVVITINLHSYCSHHVSKTNMAPKQQIHWGIGAEKVWQFPEHILQNAHESTAPEAALSSSYLFLVANNTPHHAAMLWVCAPMWAL